jgi:hypothetical protein
MKGISAGPTSTGNGGYHGCAVVGGGIQCWGKNGEGPYQLHSIAARDALDYLR